VSLLFKQVISRADTVLCTGEIRIACLAADSLKPKVIPRDLLGKLKS
jgi:acyl-CoA thioesterase FadM